MGQQIRAALLRKVFDEGENGESRQFYFTRRSLATLVEFAEAVRHVRDEIGRETTRGLTFRGPTDDAPSAWAAAIRFFADNEKLLKDVRNDIGGHFGTTAATNAVSRLQPSAFGSITLVDDRQLRLHFAAEIATTALLQHLPNGDVNEFGGFLKTCLMEGYRHATNCVYILVRNICGNVSPRTTWSALDGVRC